MVLKTKIYSVNLRIQSEYRNMGTRNNSAFGHFSRTAHSKTTIQKHITGTFDDKYVNYKSDGDEKLNIEQ